MYRHGLKQRGVRTTGTSAEELGLAITGAIQLKRSSDSIVSKAVVRIDRPAGPRQAQEWLKRGFAFAEAGNLLESCRCFEAAVRLDPNSADALNNLGVALQRLGKHDEAEARYRDSLLLSPGFIHALVNLVSLKTSLGFHQDALEIIEASDSESPEILNLKAEILGRLGLWTSSLATCNLSLVQVPRHSKTLHLKATALKELNRNEEALSAFDAAELANPSKAESIKVERAWLLAEMGRKDAALDALNDALQINPNLTAAWGHRSYLTRKVSRDDLETMERILNRPETSDADRMNLSFALVKAYLDNENGAKAFARLSEGNRLKRATIAYDPDAEERRAREIQAIFTQETLDRYAGLGNPSTQPIFVFGMPRSGTTLVEQILASHPAVFGGGEPTFLCDTISESAGVVDIARLGRRYLDRIASVIPEPLPFVDKMPWNFLYAGLISLILPNARMIHCRRDPLDTCVSCYATLFTRGQEYSYDLTELGRYYWLYDRHMAHWRSILSSERFVEVEYESLVTHTETEVRALLDFCNLPWDPACLRFHETNRRVSSASLDQVRSPIYRSSLGRGQLLRPWLGVLEAELARK
jgi:tetratricopeptide (TPR) repeat protein